MFVPCAAENSGIPRVMTPEVEEEILDAAGNTPASSTEGLVSRLHVNHAQVWRVCRRPNLYPYHLQRLQALSAADYPPRVHIGQSYPQQCAVNPIFPSAIGFTDEAQFSREGVLNYHNVHVQKRILMRLVNKSLSWMCGVVLSTTLYSTRTYSRSDWQETTIESSWKPTFQMYWITCSWLCVNCCILSWRCARTFVLQRGSI